jgi:hypothetical protein
MRFPNRVQVENVLAGSCVLFLTAGLTDDLLHTPLKECDAAGVAYLAFGSVTIGMSRFRRLFGPVFFLPLWMQLLPETMQRATLAMGAALVVAGCVSLLRFYIWRA